MQEGTVNATRFANRSSRFGKETEEREANARLIAAAPEL